MYAHVGGKCQTCISAYLKLPIITPNPVPIHYLIPGNPFKTGQVIFLLSPHSAPPHFHFFHYHAKNSFSLLFTLTESKTSRYRLLIPSTPYILRSASLLTLPYPFSQSIIPLLLPSRFFSHLLQSKDVIHNLSLI